MVLKLGMIAVGILLFSACDMSVPPHPPRPPLLVNVTAGSGWWGACPPATNTEAQMIQTSGKLALSPELDQRLLNEFPPRSNESRIIEALIKQGFEMLPPCKTDQAIHRAGSMQHEGGGLTYRIRADVFWKVDQSNAIVWTKGFVAYDGL